MNKSGEKSPMKSKDIATGHSTMNLGFEKARRPGKEREEIQPPGKQAEPVQYT
jgi:hypothetical protein